MKRLHKLMLAAVAAFLLLVSLNAWADSEEGSSTGGAQWTRGTTIFTGMSVEEKRRHLGGRVFRKNVVVPEAPLSKSVPTTLDWRSKDGSNWVTPPKYQDQCGACWAFAAVGALETMVHIAENLPVTSQSAYDFSEQHVMSCSSGTLGSDPCEGGFPETGPTILQNQGTVNEACMPYEAQAFPPNCSDRCSNYESQIRRISGWDYVTGSSSSATNIMNALQYGPVPTTMNVCDDLMEDYTGGVYSATSWCPENQGHAVLIVGYDQNNRYWIVKNSWSTMWGESGYFRISWDDYRSSFGQYSTRLSYTASGCIDDQYEQNDDQTDAISMPEGSYSSLIYCDPDYYRIAIPTEDVLTARITFTHNDGNLSLSLYDRFGTRVAFSNSSSSGDNREELTYTAPSSANYYIGVYASDGVETTYSLMIDVADGCVPQCSGKECGSNGCGGTCGTCADNESCQSGQCVCVPQCSGKECGANGCGGTCGACESYETCEDGLCTCTPDCGGKECGSNGCGGTCGSCPSEETCRDGECVCDPKCDGKECGPDACGSLCGLCDGNETCQEGVCVCQPQCQNKQCGSDGCGSVCGTCGEGSACSLDYRCVETGECAGTCNADADAPHCQSTNSVCQCDRSGSRWIELDCQQLCQIQGADSGICDMVEATSRQGCVCQTNPVDGDEDGEDIPLPCLGSCQPIDPARCMSSNTICVCDNFTWTEIGCDYSCPKSDCGGINSCAQGEFGDTCACAASQCTDGDEEPFLCAGSCQPFESSQCLNRGSLCACVDLEWTAIDCFATCVQRGLGLEKCGFNGQGNVCLCEGDATEDGDLSEPDGDDTRIDGDQPQADGDKDTGIGLQIGGSEGCSSTPGLSWFWLGLALALAAFRRSVKFRAE